jgi:hypothetical protein
MIRVTAMTIIGLALLLVSPNAQADIHLEIGVAATPTVVQGPALEAFSEKDLRMGRFGGDIRLEVASFWRDIHLLPFIGYRGATDEGYPFGMVETGLNTHDFLAGFRFRGWFQPWLGFFLEASGGLLLARMTGDIWIDEGTGARSRYEDDQKTWSAGGLLGMELRLSPTMLARRGVTKFNFGGEIGAGYIRRGDISFSPELVGGDEHSLPVESTTDWGEINLSGWVVQVGLTFSFF